MDPNTNTPTDSDEPLPLGPPLHPHDPVPPDPPADPGVGQPQIIEPSLPPPPPPMPDPALPPPPAAPGPPLPPQAPGLPPQAFIPNTPASPPPPPQGVAPAFDPQSAFNPQVPGAPPPPPIVVSGSFAPGPAMPPAAGAPNPAFQTPGTPAPSPASGKGHRLKRLLVVVAGVVILAGGSAAAYFGVIVPNQPANVLKTALFNSLKQNSVSYTGNLNFQSLGSGSSIPPFQLTMDGSRNASADASSFGLGFDGYGVKLNLEARLVDKNLYLKTGNLSTLAALAGTYVPSIAPAATTISNDVSNQWIEVDQSLLDAGGLSCFLNSNYLSFSQADINLLTSDYAEHPFLDIQSTAGATVGGQAAEEFQVNIVDNTAAGFISGLGNLSLIKSLDSCKAGPNDGENLAGSLTKVKGDGKDTPLTLWVSKSGKQIVQVKFTGSGQHIASEEAKGSLVVGFNYRPVSIPAPANSESVLQLYTKLQPTLSGLDSSGLNLNNLFSGSTSLKSATSSLINIK